MCPREYQRGEWKRLESEEGPWLDDQTTVPHRASVALHPLTGRAALERLTAVPTEIMPGKTVPPAPPPPRARGTQLSAAAPTPMAAVSYHAPLPPLPKAALLVSSAEKHHNNYSATETPRPLRAPKQNVVPLEAAARKDSISQISRSEPPESSGTVERKWVTLTRAAMTPDQLTHSALEEFWRQEHERITRAYRWKMLRRRAAAALLSILLVFGIYRSALFQQISERSIVAAISDKLHPVPMKRAQAAVGGMSGAETTNSEGDKALTQPGTLRIDSKPVARVFVDGVRIGNTPQNAISLQPGVHSLQLYNAEHVLLKDITLRVQPGETISRVEYFDR